MTRGLKFLSLTTLFFAFILVGCGKKSEVDVVNPVAFHRPFRIGNSVLYVPAKLEIVHAMIDGRVSSDESGYDLNLSGTWNGDKFVIKYEAMGDIIVTPPVDVKAGDKLGTIFPWQEGSFKVTVIKNGKPVAPPDAFRPLPKFLQGLSNNKASLR